MNRLHPNIRADLRSRMRCEVYSKTITTTDCRRYRYERERNGRRFRRMVPKRSLLGIHYLDRRSRRLSGEETDPRSSTKQSCFGYVLPFLRTMELIIIVFLSCMEYYTGMLFLVSSLRPSKMMRTDGNPTDNESHRPN